MTNEEMFDRITRPKAELLSRLKQEIDIPPQEDDEVTKEEIAKALNITTECASYRMKKLEEEGKVTSRIGRNSNGKTVRMYKWVN